MMQGTRTLSDFKGEVAKLSLAIFLLLTAIVDEA